MFNMNTRLHDKKNWFWADGYSQKHRLGKSDWILTIHFSNKNRSYVEDDNDILIEDDIVKDISFLWWYFWHHCCSCVCIGYLCKEILNENYLQNQYWSMEDTWSLLAGRFFASNKFIKCQLSRNIHQDKLQKYENNDLFVSVVSSFNSVKTGLCLK